MRSILVFCVIAVCVYSDDYLDEIQSRCYATNKAYSCAKYRIFKYVDDYSLGNVSLTSDSSVKLITVPSVNSSEINFFGKSRQYATEDSELVKMLKYGKRRIAKFFTEQGLSLELPEEAQIITEDRKLSGKSKKAKKYLIFPILILLKLFKVKIITSLILVGVIVIKKMLLMAAFILPGVVAAIKHHCKAQQYHVVPYNVDEEHYTHSHNHEDESGFELSGYGGDKHYWDKRKRFSYI